MSDAPRLFALIVGIDRFAVQPDLDGCVNDAAAMYRLLVDGFGVPDEHITLLTNEDATRDAIIDAFRSHLIDNDAIERGDQIVFHFSGHGANMLDPLDASPTGMIESLVAHDSGEEGIFGIPDTTVAALLELLADQRGDNITVVLDCCHSGSGTRDADEQAPKVRLTQADERIPPTRLDAAIVDAATALGTKKRWREDGVPYTLLAACRDRELAQEYIDDFGDEPQSYGAFTWHLTDALWRLTPATSYAMLHETVAAKVNGYNPHQMPQCEGRRDRAVFGSASIRRDPFITVTGVERGRLVLGGGRMHGIAKGATLALYPATVQTRDELPDPPIATVTVATAGPSRAHAVVDHPRPEELLHARAIVTDPGEAIQPRLVALRAADDASPAARDALDHLQKRLGHSTWVRHAATGPAELLVRATGDTLTLRAADDDRPLIEPARVYDPRDAAVDMLGALENVARFRRISEMRNTDRGSRMQGAIRLIVRRHDPDLAPTDMPIVDLVDGERSLVYDPEREDNFYLVEVRNQSPRPVFVSVFTLNADYSIARLYPTGGVEQSIDPDRSLFVGHDDPNELIDVWLPGDEPGEPYWTISRSTFKVFASITPTDLSLLEQHGLDVPAPSNHRVTSGLEALIADTVTGKRMARRRRDRVEDWATADLPFTVIRKPVDVPIGEGRNALADDVTLDAPAGFKAHAALDTLGQATRGGRALRLPPGLATDPTLRPLGRPGTRSVDDALVLRLTLDGALDPGRPIHVDLPDRGELWPVVFDGEDHLIAGYPAGDGRVAIDTLPAPTDAPAHRGAVSRTLELFFLSKTGRPSPQLGLHRVTIDDGKPTYHPLEAKDIHPGQRALLAVHGFASGTLGQIRTLAAHLDGYDHLLTYDYESLGTPIDDSAAALAAALRRAGFARDDRRTLHIVAHSMGGLVARAALERHGAHADRLVMAGTPNGGTRLFDTINGALAFANLALNTYLAPTLGVPLGVLIDQIQRAAKGPADLRADSPLLRALTAPQPGATPYLLIAGDGGLALDATAGRFKRLAAKATGLALDALFGEAHDLVVGASDMRAIQDGRHPALTVHPTACNHFDYLLDPSSLTALATFLDAPLRTAS